MKTQRAYGYAAPTLATHSPQITPNRYSLDNHFPQLAFTIYTGDKPYYEVLLTSNQALFDTQQSTARSPANFYPARPEDRRLQPAMGGSAVFIVPQAVLHAFVSATPRPQAIYYTVVAYTDATGAQPTFAQPPETLTSNAPSVSLSSDFRAETLSTVLGIPITKLRRHEGEERTAGELLFKPSVPSPADEDGATIMTLAETESSRPEVPQDGYERYHAASAQPAPLAQGYDDGFGEWPALFESHSLSVDEGEYEGDNWGDNSPFISAQESIYPPGTAEPATLHDAEEPLFPEYQVEDASAFTYDGFGPPTAALEKPDPPVETEYDEEPANDAVEADNGNTYRDEADDYGYEAAFTDEEVNDIVTPELPYEPLSASTLGNGASPQPLTIEAQRAIIERIGQFESGQTRYGAMNRDGEFRGLFGHNHPAYNRYHIGLSYGIVQFTQDSGNVGRLLNMMRTRDATRFESIFGANANALIRVTTAAGPSSAQSPNGRSARVQPVGGADLWEEPWIGRFAQAGQHVPFQAAQNELAAQLFITPILPFARWLDLTTDRALTTVVDRAVQMGVGGARAWIMRAAGPIQTLSQRQQALAALNHVDLLNFQRATPGLGNDGEWGPQSHAALTAALRALGPASPIVIPTRDQILDALVRHASRERWGHRVQTLRNATDFSDIEYSF
jgi:hypothetical protein